MFLYSAKNQDSDLKLKKNALKAYCLLEINRKVNFLTNEMLN